MSRLFAKYLMEQNGIDVDQFDEELVSHFGKEWATGIYFKSTKMFRFKCLDFYSYVRFKELNLISVSISEPDLLRMIRIDSYGEDEKNELYYHNLLGRSGGSDSSVEQEELDDDVFWGISILQYFYHISKNAIVLMKRQAHTFRLYRSSSKAFVLKKRVLHSNGGRPVGALGSLSSSEMQNIEMAGGIETHCVELDRYEEYMMLARDLIKAKQKFETGEPITLTGAKWKFYILRYKWKIGSGFAGRDLEYEKELVEKNERYKIFNELNF